MQEFADISREAKKTALRTRYRDMVELLARSEPRAVELFVEQVIQKLS